MKVANESFLFFETYKTRCDFWAWKCTVLNRCAIFFFKVTLYLTLYCVKVINLSFSIKIGFTNYLTLAYFLFLKGTKPWF